MFPILIYIVLSCLMSFLYIFLIPFLKRSTKVTDLICSLDMSFWHAILVYKNVIQLLILFSPVITLCAI